MTTLAKDIIRAVVTDTLQDPTSIRWTVNELIRYLNDGQREAVLHRPDVTATHVSHNLAAGALQALPAGGIKLLDVVRNDTTASKRAIRECDQKLLDGQLPGWQGLVGQLEILHFMYDPREPRKFYVYPPAASGAKVELAYCASPVDIPPVTGGDVFGVKTWADMGTEPISLQDIHANALRDYILHRAYMKETESAVAAGGAPRAQTYYAAFALALGIEIKATAAVGPKR